MRRIIFTPAVELKDELKSTAVVISCYDRDGKEVKRVTSADDAEIDDGTGGSSAPSGGSSDIPGGGSSDVPGGGSSDIPGSGGVTPGEAGDDDGN